MLQIYPRGQEVHDAHGSHQGHDHGAHEAASYQINSYWKTTLNAKPENNAMISNYDLRFSEKKQTN